MCGLHAGSESKTRLGLELDRLEGETWVQINISMRHGHLSQETRGKVSEKVAKLSRFYERLSAVDITVDVEQQNSASVEMQVSAEHAQGFVATDTSSSLMAAVDGTIHKLEQQLRKHKEKLKGHKVMGLKHQEVPLEPVPEATDNPAGETGPQRQGGSRDVGDR